MKWSKTEGLVFAVAGLMSLSALQMVAQEKPPVEVAGAEVATDKTPAAASSAEELRKSHRTRSRTLLASRFRRMRTSTFTRVTACRML